MTTQISKPSLPWGASNNCKTCRSWEPDFKDCAGQLLERAPIGYCPTFQNMTNLEDGASCTAWHPILAAGSADINQPGSNTRRAVLANTPPAAISLPNTERSDRRQ